MCGIGFFVSNKYSIPLSLVVNILLKQLERGTQGAGVAWKHGNHIVILKKAMHPQTFRYSQSIRPILENTYSNAIIVHNRQPSQGGKGFRNTHPFYGCEHGKQALCHNGHFSNHKALRRFLKLKGHKFQGSTDTETMIHIYEELHDFEKFASVLDELSPGAVLLLTTTKLFIYRSHNPIVILISEDGSTIIGGSTKKSVDYLKKQLKKMFGIKFKNKYYTVDTNTYVVIDIATMKVENEENFIKYVERVVVSHGYTWWSGSAYGSSFRPCPYKNNPKACPTKNYSKCKFTWSDCPYSSRQKYYSTTTTSSTTKKKKPKRYRIDNNTIEIDDTYVRITFSSGAVSLISIEQFCPYFPNHGLCPYRTQLICGYVNPFCPYSSSGDEFELEDEFDDLF